MRSTTGWRRKCKSCSAYRSLEKLDVDGWLAGLRPLVQERSDVVAVEQLAATVSNSRRRRRRSIRAKKVGGSAAEPRAVGVANEGVGKGAARKRWVLLGVLL